jgi:transcriptional regulator with XRE-family HTH domain
VPVLPKLKFHRRRAGLTQVDLARASTVDRTTIQRLESKRPAPAPHPSTVRKLAQALGVQPADLWGPDGPPDD